MTVVWSLALNTFREAVRDRVLHSIVFFAVITLGASLLLKDLTLGDQDKIVRSIAEGGIDLFASLIAMFLGISLIWKELDKKTIYTILSKPMPRWQFVIGKYVGLLATVGVEILLLMGLYVLLMLVQQDFPSMVFFVSMGMLMVELMLLTAWTTLFSTYSAPTTASAFTISIFVIGHLADDLWLLGSKSDSLFLEQVVHGLYWVLPNFELLSIRELSVHERTVPWEQVFAATGYGIAYSIVVLLMAVTLFQRKDIR